MNATDRAHLIYKEGNAGLKMPRYQSLYCGITCTCTCVYWSDNFNTQDFNVVINYRPEGSLSPGHEILQEYIEHALLVKLGISVGLSLLEERRGSSENLSLRSAGFLQHRF